LGSVKERDRPQTPKDKMVRKKPKSRRLGTLLFVLPVVAIAAVVVVGLVGPPTVSQSGTLIVEAISSQRYAPSVSLQLSATVVSKTATTPFNLTLPAGVYTVTYASSPWFVAPPPKSVLLTGGQTEYAIGTYTPLPKAIAIGEQGFNSTLVKALHGVTPVVWVNLGPKVVEVEIEGFGIVRIQPSLNFTHVFQPQGNFIFFLVNSAALQTNGYVQSE